MGAGGDRGEGGEMVWGRVWLVGEKPSPQRESSDESINPSTITREAVGSMAEVVTFRVGRIQNIMSVILNSYK